MHTGTLIVGGGLAGLSLAARLQAAGQDYLLVEADDRLGGRILSHSVDGADFDLGPAWFWPSQPRMAALVEELGLRVFEQYSQGAILFQDQSGQVHRDHGYASMQGSLRVSGGMIALADGLRNRIADERVQINTRVASITRSAGFLLAETETAAGSERIRATTVVLAIPPRVAAETIAFSPQLPGAASQALQAIPTWMAGQAKILAVYDRPYWREAGLSGDAMGQKGPLAEIHDASPVEGGPYALFGFVDLPAAIRALHFQAILELARDQLAVLFGASMANPLEIRMVDWAQNRRVATSRDHAPPRSHPAYGTPHALSDLWSGDLIFASTETGAAFGGYLEGALEAAEAAAIRLGVTTPAVG